MPMRTLSRLAALAAVAALVAAFAVPAFAHAPVTGTSPKKNATVSAVRTVSVRFGEAVVTGKISVKNANGRTMSARASGLADGKKRLRATFSRKLPSGKYTVSWRVRADDGDSETGTFRFTVR
jgi:methionine-rich copper-binding protein CopC